LKKPPFDLLALGAMCLTTSVLTACVDTPPPSPSPPHTVTPQPETDFELPAPVYFLREGQVFRLSRDGETQQQITREAVAVESFDVSPVDGALVYVAGNALIHQAALWADDSRGVLVVTASASGEIPADTLLWLPVDGNPAIRLPITGPKMLRWGAGI